PVVSLFTPAANATQTGAVTLTATAVDDRELAEVRFQLDGQDLGAATTTDLTPTKYTLSWDSRGGANGAHTLTATTRDATGNATTSAGIRSEEHTSELQSRGHLVCRLLLEKKK